MNNYVCQFSSVHAADDVRILAKESTSLAEAGYMVRLFARPPKGDQPPPASVDVTYLPRSQGRIRRLTVGLFQTIVIALRARCDVFHFHDAELILAGLLVKARGGRVIYDVHEDLPLQVQSKPWIPSPLRSMVGHLVRAVEATAGRAFDGIVAATPDIARRFPASKTVVVQNFPKLAESGVVGPSEASAGRRNAVVYVGGLYQTRGVFEMLQSIGLAATRPRPTLVLAGPIGDAVSEDEIHNAKAASYIEYHSWLTQPEVKALYRNVRAGLVVLHPEPRFMTSYPVKMFEYMAAGLPVIASDFPLWRSIIDEAQCGLLVDPFDPAGIARAIDWVIDHPEEAEEMGQRGRQAVESRYNWEAESKKLIALYQRLLA